MNYQITHAVTKITCFRECAEGSDISINSFIFLLVSGVESVPFKGFVQFSDGEFVELCINLARSFLSSGLSNWKLLKIFSVSTPIQWRNNATLYANGFISS